MRRATRILVVAVAVTTATAVALRTAGAPVTAALLGAAGVGLVTTVGLVARSAPTLGLGLVATGVAVAGAVALGGIGFAGAAVGATSLAVVVELGLTVAASPRAAGVDATARRRRFVPAAVTAITPAVVAPVVALLSDRGELSAAWTLGALAALLVSGLALAAAVVQGSPEGPARARSVAPPTTYAAGRSDQEPRT